METHLFGVGVNQQGRSLLLRMKKWAMFFYGCTIVSGVFDSMNAYLVIETYKKYASRYSYYMKIHSIVSVPFLIMYSSLLIFSAYYFYQFTTKSVSSMKQENELEYNNSFGFLMKHIIASSVLFTLNSLWSLLLVIIYIKAAY